MRKTFLPFSLKICSSVLVLSALALPNAHAAGLGKLTVLSALGQPLRAEIELHSVAKEDAGAIVAKLAPSEAFRKARIDFNPALTSLRFSVEKRGSRQIIRITSAQAMNEPFVDMLLELNSSSGRLVREYTFLLDPAELRTGSAAQAVSPVMVPALSTRTPLPPLVKQAAPAPAESKKPVKVVHKAQPAEKVKADKGAPGHRVKKGDNLTTIARTNKSEEVSLEQMLVAIYRANPDAFAGHNMNRLRVGKVLSIPDADTAGSIGQSEANKEVVAQAADFNNYRNRLAGAVAQSAPQKATEAGQVAGGKIGAKVEERPTPATESKDKLKVSKAEAAKGDKAPGVVSTEDKLAKDKAAADSSARVKELEKNISDLQAVLQLKNKDLAAQQKQAETPASSASVPAASVPAAAMASASTVVPAPAVASKPVAPKKKVVVPPPPPEPSFFEELLENKLVIGALGLLVAALAAMGIRNSRRRKQAAQQLADGMPDESGDAPNSLFGKSGGQSVDTNNSIFNSSFTPSASLLDTNEVDPVAEADVYIAYGREAQAIEILKEALRNHPERNALRVKLLEIYASQKDVHSFDLLASELYGLTRGEGEDWVYVAGLGVAIDPNNPLYAGGDLSEELLARPSSLQTSVTRPSEELDPDVRLAMSRTPDAAEQEMSAQEVLHIPSEQLANPDFPLELDPVDTPAVADTMDSELPSPAVASVEQAVAFHAVPDFVLDSEKDVKAAEELKAVEADSGLDFFIEKPAAKSDMQEPESKPKHEPGHTSEQSSGLEFDLGDFNFDNNQPSMTAAEPEPEPVSAHALDVKELSADDLDYLTEFKPQASSESMTEKPVAASLQRESASEKLHEPAPEKNVNTPEILPELESDLRQPASATPPFDFGSINLDLTPSVAAQDNPSVTPAADQPARSGSIEMDTKLDLADAYLGIGDKEGARELLEEVIQDGSDEQVERAKSTLTRIA